MNEIPQIIEDLYFQTVTIPDEKDWPESMKGSITAIHGLYGFYYGLRLGLQLSEAVHRED